MFDRIYQTGTFVTKCIPNYVKLILLTILVLQSRDLTQDEIEGDIFTFSAVLMRYFRINISPLPFYMCDL